MKRPLILAATVLALAGCSDQWQTFNTREAGADLDAGYFGNATMNNNLAQTGASSYAINLNNRFSTEVSPTVTFAFNSAVLDDQARAVLRQQATWIKQFPEVRFRVYGHTDLVGSAAYNRQLGLRRAEAVVLYLTSQGISRDRLEAVVSSYLPTRSSQPATRTSPRFSNLPSGCPARLPDSLPTTRRGAGGASAPLWESRCRR